MNTPTTLEVLKEWHRTVIGGLITKLNKDGIASDEDGLGLSSTMIENWTVSCDAYLVEKGYRGGSLKTLGNYIPSLGAVYILYDTDSFTDEEAKNHLLTFSS